MQGIDHDGAWCRFESILILLLPSGSCNLIRSGVEILTFT
jgi:hypothetical protein